MTKTMPTTRTREPLYNGMNLLDGCGLWYRATLEMVPDAKAPIVDVYHLAEILPHGSGIDGNWTIQVKRNGDVSVVGEYHAMNENGYYCGWRNFRAMITKCRKQETVKLIGPMDGKWQVTRVKGRAYLTGFIGGGDAKDYLYDVVSCSLGDDMGVHAIESGLVVNDPNG